MEKNQITSICGPGCLPQPIYRVLSFHMGCVESMAMWKIYGEDISIRIKTTRKKFNESITSFPNNWMMKCAYVKYIDYHSKDLYGGEIYEEDIDRVFVRPKYYEYEKEYRVLIFDPNYVDINKDRCDGFFQSSKPIVDQMINTKIPIIESADDFVSNGFIQVNLNILIEEVRCSPNCPSFIVDNINKLLKTYGLNIEVIPSDFLDTPSKRKREI